MNTVETKWLSYSDVRQRQRNSPLRQSEIPVEHAVSLPMPTLRFGTPVYAGFASPAQRQPQQPMRQNPPDRLGAVDARSGHLLLYASTTVFPIAADAHWETVTLPPAESSVEELRQGLAQIEAKLNGLAPAFFAGEAGDKAEREARPRRWRRSCPTRCTRSTWPSRRTSSPAAGARAGGASSSGRRRVKRSELATGHEPRATIGIQLLHDVASLLLPKSRRIFRHTPSDHHSPPGRAKNWIVAGDWLTADLAVLPEAVAVDKVESDAGSVVVGAVAGIQSGQRLAVFGAGGLGHLAIQIAKAMGVHVGE